MGLLSTEADVVLCNNIKYYESLGYDVPKYYDEKHKKYSVKRGSRISVKISDLPLNSHAIVNVKCDKCEKEYEMEYRIYLKYSHDNNIYCNSCACSIFNSGENNLMWNPNLTNEERLLKRNYPEYIEFVKRVLNRDNYICQCCGVHSNKLEVHHLDGYSWCKEKRLNVDNGISLCNDCHSNFHFVYSRNNNTKEQFEEWIGYTVHLIACENITLQKARKVYCIEENKTYDSAKNLSDECNVKISEIYKCCHYRNGSTAKGKHYIWADEVKGLNQEEVFNLIKEQKIQHLLKIERQHDDNNKEKNICRPIICLNTNQVFVSATDASNYYNISHCGIIRCCKNTQNTSGSLSDGTRLTWMFYSDYLNNKKGER